MLIRKILVALGCCMLAADALALLDVWLPPPAFPVPAVIMAIPVGTARELDVNIVPPARVTIWWQDTRTGASTRLVRLAAPLSVADGLLVTNVCVVFILLVAGQP